MPNVMPCALNPAWDIPTPPSDEPLPDGYAEHIEAAIDGCYDCPILGVCAQLADHNPPAHACVQAAQIWAGGRTYTLDEWLAGLPDLPPEAPASVQRACAWHRCGQMFWTDRPTRLYHQRQCKKAAEGARARRRQLTGAGVAA